jgi:hypothetical protein
MAEKNLFKIKINYCQTKITLSIILKVIEKVLMLKFLNFKNYQQNKRKVPVDQTIILLLQNNHKTIHKIKFKLCLQNIKIA